MTIDALRSAVARERCESNHLFFSRYFFKHRQAIKFLVNWHHHLIAEEVDRVVSGECRNLIINVPPGSSKTELVAINLMARGLAKNPRARFLHISYSDDLALLNSQTARELVQSDEYQDLWPLSIADDAKSKKRWNVLVDGKKCGGVYAVSLGGQITGFRAGHMTPGWQGAIIIDDPLKPEDAFSKTKRDTANRRLLSTIKSRKANPKTPIIVIMQRLHVNDCTGFIQSGNLPGKWKEIIIPALIDDEYVSKLPPHIQAMVDSTERDESGRFSYWPYKEPLSELLEMEKGASCDKDGAAVSRYVMSSQYQQNPQILGGELIHSRYFKRYTITPRILYRNIYADTAQKTAEHNDYSVFQCWGMGDDGRIYLLDQIRGKWEAPELERKAVDFWNKHVHMPGVGALRQLIVEEASSGTGLIQSVRAKAQAPIAPVDRGTQQNKLSRVMDILGYIEAGFVCIPEEAPWVSDFTGECDAFNAAMTHDHDDQVDPMIDAIKDMLAGAVGGLIISEEAAGMFG